MIFGFKLYMKQEALEVIVLTESSEGAFWDLHMRAPIHKPKSLYSLY